MVSNGGETVDSRTSPCESHEGYRAGVLSNTGARDRNRPLPANFRAKCRRGIRPPWMALGQLEPEHERGDSGEQNGSSADSQADCGQVGPTRRLEELQTAVFASRSGKATESPATGTLSHKNPPPKGGRWLPHRPGLMPINLTNSMRSTRIVLRGLAYIGIR